MHVLRTGGPHISCMNSVTLHMVGSSCLIWGGAFETGFGYIEPDYPRRLGMAGWAGVGWGGVGAGGEDQFRKCVHAISWYRHQERLNQAS